MIAFGDSGHVLLPLTISIDELVLQLLGKRDIATRFDAEHRLRQPRDRGRDLVMRKRKAANVFAIRYFGWTPGEVGLVFGSLGTVAGLFGTWLGGRLTDWLAPKDTRWLMWLPALAGLFAIPFDMAGAFAVSVTILFVTSPAGVICRTLPLAAVAATIQRLAADDVRARAAATVGVVATLLGLGVGPTVVGVLSDVLKPLFANDALRFGLVALALPQALCAFHFWRAARTVSTDLIE